MKKVVELFCFVSLRFVLFVAAMSLSLDARCMARVFSERWKKKCKGDGRERGSVVGDRANGLDLFVARFSTARFSLRRPTVRSTSIDFRVTPFFDESNRVA